MPRTSRLSRLDARLAAAPPVESTAAAYTRGRNDTYYHAGQAHNPFNAALAPAQAEAWERAHEDELEAFA